MNPAANIPEKNEYPEPDPNLLPPIVDPNPEVTQPVEPPPESQ